MFGWGAKKPTPAAPGRALSGYVAQTVMVARPDTAVIGRLDALTGRIGASLAGRTGTVIGADRGDPTRSLTGPVRGVIDGVSTSMAEITSGPGSHPLGVPDYADSASTNPALDPYRSLLWDRMQR